jgi:lipopolysaccharide heptosyltransferase II
MSGIGDVLWTTPLLANLKLAYPNARIGYVVRKASALVLENNPHVDRVHIFEKETLAYQAGFLRELSKERYDMSIDVICSPATAIQSVVCGAKDRIGFDFRGRKWLYNHVLSQDEANRGHAVEFNLAVLDYLGIPRTHTELVWSVSDKEKAHALTTLQELGVNDSSKLVGLIPTGGYESKKWPVEYYTETARRLFETHNAQVMVFWGNQNEEQDAQRIASEAGKQVHALPKQTLRHTAALLKQCKLVIGNDSGPTHIAGAVGTRVIALYGPSNHLSHGPWGVSASTLRAPNADSICCKKITCTKPGHPCMRELTPELVVKEVQKIL